MHRNDSHNDAAAAKVSADNQKQQQQLVRDNERIRMAEYYRSVHGIVDVRRLDNITDPNYDYDPREDAANPDELVAGIDTASFKRFGLLQDGLYEFTTRQDKKYNFWIKEGTAYLTVPVNSEPAYTEAMTVLVKALSAGQGYNTMTFDWGASRDPGYFERGFDLFSMTGGSVAAGYNLLKNAWRKATGQPLDHRTPNLKHDNLLNRFWGAGVINTRMEELHKFLDVCEREGTKVKLGPHAQEWLDRLSQDVGLGDKLWSGGRGNVRLNEVYDRIRNINQAYMDKHAGQKIPAPTADNPNATTDMYRLCQNQAFKDRRRTLLDGVEEKLSDGTVKRTTTLDKEFPGATLAADEYKAKISKHVGDGALTPDKRLQCFEAELQTIEARQRALNSAVTELRQHTDGVEAALTSKTTDPSLVQQIVTDCIQRRTMLESSIKAEQADLDTRVTQLQSVYNEAKTTVPVGATQPLLAGADASKQAVLEAKLEVTTKRLQVTNEVMNGKPGAPTDGLIARNADLENKVKQAVAAYDSTTAPRARL